MAFGLKARADFRVLGWTAGAAIALSMVGAPSRATAAEPADPLAAYGRLPGFENARLSPSGNHTAILASLSDVRTLIVLDGNRKPLIRLPIGKAKVRDIAWAGDDAVLVRYSETVALDEGFSVDRAELTSAVVVPLSGAKPWPLLSRLRDVTGGVWRLSAAFQRDGKWFVHAGTITLANDFIGEGASLPNGRLIPDLYEINIATGEGRLIAEHSRIGTTDRYWLANDKGEIAAILDFSRTQGDWTVRDRDRKALASGRAPLGGISLVGFTPDGSGVVYSVRDQANLQDQLYAVPLNGGEPKPFMEGVGYSRLFTDDGDRIIGYAEEAAAGTAHFFDARRDQIYRASQKAFPGKIMNLIGANAAFNRLIVTTEGEGDPLVWWVVDIASGRADILGTSYPVPSDRVAPFRMVPYKAADGLAMEGVLTLPPGQAARNLPAVILPHGGPTSRDQLGFDWMAQTFASRGYAVFQPNFRGSTGYGVAFEKAGHGEWGRKMQTDISDGLAELVRQSIVDPARVCIMGASYGGYAALAGVTLQKDLYRCAVSIGGIGDVARMVAVEASESGRDSYIVRSLREEVGSGRNLTAISPIRFVDTVKAPILLIHGKDDTVVSPLQSSSMASALRRAGKTVEYVELPNEDHWLSRSEGRLAALRAAVGFVERHNPPGAPVAAR